MRRLRRRKRRDGELGKRVEDKFGVVLSGISGWSSDFAEYRYVLLAIVISMRAVLCKRFS